MAVLLLGANKSMAEETTIWEGEIEKGDSWLTLDASLFANVTSTTILRVYIETTWSGRGITITDNNNNALWGNTKDYTAFSDYYKGGYFSGIFMGYYYEFVVGNFLNKVKEGGLRIKSKGARIYKVTLDNEERVITETVPLTIGEHQWATFSSTKALDFTNVSGVTAYIAKSISSTKVQLEQVTTVAANTGLVVNGNAATYDIPVANSGTDYSSSNLMQAVSSETTVTSSNCYVLTYQNGQVEFAQITSSHSATVPEGYAYLQTSGSQARRLSISIGSGDDTTGIRNLNSEDRTDGFYYNLSGQRVENPAKGIYIRNGKKVLIK